MKTAITDRPWFLAGKKQAEKVIGEYGAVTKVMLTHTEVDEERPSVCLRYFVHFYGGRHTGIFTATISRSRDKNAESGGYWLIVKREIEVYQTGKN